MIWCTWNGVCSLFFIYISKCEHASIRFRWISGEKNTIEQKRTKFLVKYLNVSLFAISWYFGRLFAFGTFVCWSFGFHFFSLSLFSLCSHWCSNRRMNSSYVCQIDLTDCRAQRFYSFKCICSNDEIIIKILFLDVHKKKTTREKKIKFLLCYRAYQRQQQKRNKKCMFLSVWSGRLRFIDTVLSSLRTD